MNLNTTFAHVFNFRTEIYDNVTKCNKITLTHMCNIQMSNKIKICLMENLGYSTAA